MRVKRSLLALVVLAACAPGGKDLEDVLLAEGGDAVGKQSAGQAAWDAVSTPLPQWGCGIPLANWPQCLDESGLHFHDCSWAGDIQPVLTGTVCAQCHDGTTADGPGRYDWGNNQDEALTHAAQIYDQVHSGSM